MTVQLSRITHPLRNGGDKAEQQEVRQLYGKIKLAVDGIEKGEWKDAWQQHIKHYWKPFIENEAANQVVTNHPYDEPECFE